MDNQNTDAKDLVLQARDALRRGDKESARRLGEQAALQNPGLEDAWLILTASEPNPEDALAYAQQALEINPSSPRALKAVEWAIAQLRQAQAGASIAAVAPAPVPATAEPITAPVQKKSNNRLFLFAAIILALLLCAVIAYTAYTALMQPTFTSLISRVSIFPTQEKLWAPVVIGKASDTPVGTSSADQQQATEISTYESTEEPSSAATEIYTPVATETSAAIPTDTAAPQLSDASTQAPTGAASATPQATETPGAMMMEIVEDTPTSAYVPPSSSSSAPLPSEATSGNGTRWIDVDLTNQRVYAYEGDVVVNSFIVSTGTWLTPTVTGQYKIYVKYRSAAMSGPGYYLPNVPYIMYFYKGYGLHGTYWHNNFGTPMSHGCVNLRTDEAAWLYSWSSVGTLVNVHY